MDMDRDGYGHAGHEPLTGPAAGSQPRLLRSQSSNARCRASSSCTGPPAPKSPSTSARMRTTHAAQWMPKRSSDETTSVLQLARARTGRRRRRADVACWLSPGSNMDMPRAFPKWQMSKHARRAVASCSPCGEMGDAGGGLRDARGARRSRGMRPGCDAATQTCRAVALKLTFTLPSDWACAGAGRTACASRAGPSRVGLLEVYAAEDGSRRVALDVRVRGSSARSARTSPARARISGSRARTRASPRYPRCSSPSTTTGAGWRRGPGGRDRPPHLLLPPQGRALRVRLQLGHAVGDEVRARVRRVGEVGSLRQ